MDMGFLKDFELKFLVNINHGLCVTIYYYLVLDVNIWVFTKNTYYICTYICMCYFIASYLAYKLKLKFIEGLWDCACPIFPAHDRFPEG